MNGDNWLSNDLKRWQQDQAAYRPSFLGTLPVRGLLGSGSFGIRGKLAPPATAFIDEDVSVAVVPASVPMVATTPAKN